MDFIIQHQTSAYLRLRLRSGRFTSAEGDVLEYALRHLRGVSDIQFFPFSGGITLHYEGDLEEILRKLRALHFNNVKLFAEKLGTSIDREELRRRKLSPAVKRSLRTKIFVETAADLLLPTPVQVGYHVYQLVTLKNL